MPEGGPNWRTSSYTGTETCVEVASDTPGCVMVRDTKRRDGGTITVGPPRRGLHSSSTAGPASPSPVQEEPAAANGTG
ncbi:MULTISPECIES: DUF397 domain-containing protein [unclassified Streptomyces]|uniref:DUF397 domain-containing protein n=1 Tax=unclassified Streptomyces TaxID=2593676 RepID=UPI002E2BB79E|nr:MULTISPECIES: DUF397 domain-containing protein [unclassified Streptomyces]